MNLKSIIKGIKNPKKIINYLFRLFFIKLNSQKTIFSKIYNLNYWENSESISGEGSSIENTKVIRKELPLLLKKYKINSILDCPCGDFNWMKEVNLNVNSYIGGDIVSNLIIQNNEKWSTKNIKFKEINIIDNILPQVDLIFCRDCLVHFSFKDIKTTIKNIKQSKSKYITTTTFTNIIKNKDIKTGDWRAINLQLPPFNFPRPLKLINEGCKEADGKYSDKCLGIYEIKDIVI